ncbi:response regulator [Pedobacter chinensis]|uniref:Response regulator n=1 Tax=Pedobacter chinensis TaxID=2282421 RepID=A0A369PZE6_9SPHI|nr:sigma 54-interacting response regulator [Pedobacter chinensis]RDC56357.1 response regulator [Pedobacter chinensis]
MNEKILIVEDQFVEAHDLQLMLEKEGYEVCGLARDVPSAIALLEKEKPTLVLVDIFLSGPATGIDLAHRLREEGIAFIYTSANSNMEVLEAAKKTVPYGFLVKPYREKDLLVTLEIARYHHEHRFEAGVKKEHQFKKQLETLFLSQDSVEGKMLEITKALQGHIAFDFIYTGFADEVEDMKQDLGFLRISFDEYQTIRLGELKVITNLGNIELLTLRRANIQSEEITYFGEDDFKTLLQKPSLHGLFAKIFNIKSHLLMPVVLQDGRLYNFYFYSRSSDIYDTSHVFLASRLAQSLAPVITKISRGKANRPQFPAGPKPEHKNDAKIADTVYGFEGIIGKSHLLLSVFDHISQVAPADASVLVLGESGTGKERIADCIHRLSPRKDQPLIKINCATLPANLIESELFGHERGSFTGATERRIGKFEMANKGTLFLDEIGEMHPELQGKLLRVLQEKEVERIGGKTPIKVDVRIIAATNRNLEKEVGEGRFRLDLYYRLNIFPIQLPALRDRLEDLPVLIDHFIAIYNRKSNKRIVGVSAKVLKQFMAYKWPGNIRELENVIERGVILARENTINEVIMPNFGTMQNDMQNMYAVTKSIEENERSHIVAVLKKCNGKIWGFGGAAEQLNVPPTTLNSKMKKLGIRKHDYKE